MQTDIKLENMTLVYKDQTLFQNLNMSFQGGSWSGLLGPSGVGKTSLIRLIAGLPTGGKSITGQVNTTAFLNSDLSSPHKNDTRGDRNNGIMAYFSQHDSLMPWLSTLNNVLLGYHLRRQSTKTIKNRAIDLLAQAGLAQAVHKKPHELSGGMRQRVALVRTLIEDKPIVLMDEPFSALDAITRLNLQTLAYDLLKDKTVILVTHDPLEALRLCDQIYIMSGSPVEIKDPIKPQQEAPRDPSDPELLNLQSHLLTQLQTAYEDNPS